MKAKEGFLAVGFCILIVWFLFVFPAKTGAAEVSDTEPPDVYQESMSGEGDEDSGAWTHEGDEGYRESQDEEQYSEEPEGEGLEYEDPASDPGQEPSEAWPSDEETSPLSPPADDDMADRSIEE